MSERKINVAIVGLGFGAEFIPIYQRHPHANMYAICQRTRKKLDAIGDAFGVEKRFDDFSELLKDPDIDAVHINSPIPDHAWQSIAALEADKHVACTVPMATSIEDCQKIVDLVRQTKKKYMMMETVVYAREFLYIKELYEKGELGKVQFLQASHQQDMDGWPNYWPGLPPMWYATHCVGPMLGLTKATAMLRLALCHRDGAHQVQEFGRQCAHHPVAVRHGAAVSGEHRRLWVKEILRVDADRARAARVAHGEAAGAEDSKENQSAGLREAVAQADPAVHDQGGI